MSDNSDASVSPIIAKGKRKAPVLTDTDIESDSSVSDIDVTVLRRNGKRKNQIRESDSDSSIEKPRKLKRVPRVTSDSQSSSDESEIVKSKKPARVVSDDSNNSDSDSDASGASDNGFEDNTSDGWESDWISESEIEKTAPIVNTNENNSVKPAAINLGNISDSSDGESEKCPICLLSFNTQEVGTPETCDHSFCADCIQEWSKNVNTCPVDRQTFTLILVRKRYNGKVIRTVPVDVRRPSVDELIQEDPTFCEICGLSDREDRLLLCDGCDLGYHLECLDPPMDTVPVEEWFCANCRQDNGQQQPQRGGRGEYRLLPRTRQSERVRATIEINRNNSSINADQQSLSSGFEDVAMPGPSRSSSTQNRSRNAAPPKKQRKKRSRRAYKKKRASFTVSYEICEVTGEKIAVKKKRKRKTKKRTKLKARRSKRRVIKPKTVKKRLAYQLGMCPSKKAGLAIPEVKVKGNVSNIGNIGFQRSQAGIPTLHLFGQRDQLDYFSASEDETTMTGGGNLGVLTQIRISSSNMGAMRRAARRKAVALSPVPPISVNSVDILSSILDSQEKLHSKNSVISVSRDGTLHIEQSERSRNESNNNNIVKPSSDNIISENPPLDVSHNGEIETTQAPMFPGRGGGGNRQPYGFHNRGGYRGGDNRYDGGSGGGYNHFQAGGPRGRGGYGPNMYNQRDNYGGGYMNYHHHSGPPPPFRGRGGPRFPMRRPQLHNQQQQQPVSQPEEPMELNLDEPMEQSTTDEQSRQPEEDIDIYSDIETSTPLPEDEVSQIKPTEEPEPALVSQVYNNSGSDDDSGSELIIDDTVKDNDKYDPTQPSADTDSNSEPALILNEPERPKENTENVNISSEKIEKEEDSKNNTEAELPKEMTKLSPFSTEAVNEAVQQVIKEHLSTPSKTAIIDNDDDDEDALDDEDCPNFSIYSSTSIDIAKATDISVDIPKENNKMEEEKPCNVIESENVVDCESKAKEAVWETSDEWENIAIEENQNLDDKVESKPTSETGQQSTLDKPNNGDDIEDINEPSISPQIHEDENKIDEEKSIENSQTIEKNIDQPEKNLTPESDEVDKIEKSDDTIISDIVHDTISNIENIKDGNESPKPDSALIDIPDDQTLIQNSASPPVETVPIVPLIQDNTEDEEKVTTSVKIAFTPGKKYQPASNKKERVLQLYDDSDWEEWESKNEVDKSLKPSPSENVTAELDKLTEAISEEERSYTPCLDEREPTKGQFSDEERNMGAGIGGMDTELISDEERNDMFDESHDMKTISDGDALEINAKESELDMTRPEDYEEGEIIEKSGAKKVQENQVEKAKQSGSDDEKNKKRVKKKPEKELEKSKIGKETDKQGKKPEFKKISKSNKDRNYRDKEKARSKSKEKKDKENKENRKDDRKKKERKRDLERYNVRSIIAEKPKKDQFGRDINKSPSRSSRSLSPRRSRSHSWNRTKRRRRRSRSLRRSRSRSASRSRSRGKSPRRSRSLRRSRSPRRSRSKSFRRSRSPRSKRYRIEYRSSSRDRERNRRYRDRSRRRSAEKLRNKKKNRSVSRTRARSRSQSLSKHRIRGEWARSVDETRRQSYTREWTPSWSRSPTPPRPVPRHNLPQSMSPSWTPPLIEKGTVQPENLTVILTNNEVNKTKKKEKKKKGDKKSKDEYRKRKRGDRTPPPSKEVFASGDNILVSVSFNKTSEENAVATREVTGVKRKRDESIKKKKEKVGEKKKKRAKSPRTKKKNKEIANLKPVAIIDLDRSPFKEITPSPKDIIVLSDSDNCEKEDETMGQHDMMQEELMSLGAPIQEDSAPQSPTANYLNSTGPKTPPEPQIKFLLTSKQSQLRQINNPLHDPNDENEVDIDPQEELEHRLDDVLHKGPNTPPEPPSSPPSSPDAYDPFDPTKSRSPTPEVAEASQPNNSAMNTPGDKTESEADLVDLAVGPLESSQKSTGTMNETSEKCSGSTDRTKRLSSSPERTSQTLTPPHTSDQPIESSDSNKNDPGDKNSNSPERSIGVVINQQVQQQFPAVVKPIIPTTSVITSTPAVPNATLPRTNLFNTPSSVSGTPRIPASIPQRIILPTPAKSSPAKMSPLKTSPSKPPIKSTPIKPMPSKTMISKLPVPNMKPITPVRKGPQQKAANRNVGQNGNEVIDVDLDFESPYSPGSSDYEDLFEPPTESTKNNSSSRAPSKNTTKSPAKQNTFDTLFGSSPVFRQQNNKSNKSKGNAAKIPVKMNKKATPTKAGTKTVGVKIDEDNLKILDDLPNSAVEMQVKDKFLKKLNRQERVVEEVKLVLKPHYNKKHVTKEQYKDILRRAVPKICHNRSGEINPKKIQNLIEAYVKKARHNKKPAAGGATTNTSTTNQQSKPKKSWKEMFFWCD